MLYIVLAYLMLFAALTNSVCLNNASFFFLFKYFLCQGYELSGEIALKKITIIITCIMSYATRNVQAGSHTATCIMSYATRNVQAGSHTATCITYLCLTCASHSILMTKEKYQ